MFHQVNRFVSRFRDLEQQEYPQTREEERQWKLLKDKLATQDREEAQHVFRRTCIAVTSLYVQAGASFIAANTAYAWAGKGIPVTLCELPGATSYYYFALDCERRVQHHLKQSPTSLLLMPNSNLRIQIDTPSQHPETSRIDTAEWLLRTSKDSPVVMIDVSSRWREEEAKRIFEAADEIWVVFDADLARLTRLLLMETAPPWWTSEKGKIKLIANKWNDLLSRSSVMKRIEGTLSLWNKDACATKVDSILPLMDGEKTARAHAKANLLLELYPEEEHGFQSLVHAHKGRMS